MKFQKILRPNCSVCDKIIHYRPYDKNNVMYLCGDTYVCSVRCSQKRLRKIISVDPNLDTPMNWKTIYNSNTTIKRSTSQQRLNSEDFVINIPVLELIKEEEQKEEGTDDENMNDCDSIRAIIITILLDGIIQIVDVIIRIFY